MKYKVGDKVRIVKERTKGMNGEGGMDKYLGTIMTISFVDKHNRYRMVQDDGSWPGGWLWGEKMIEGLVEEEWKPTEGEYVKAIDRCVVLNCIFLFWNKEGKPVCVGIGDERDYEMGDDSYTVTTWESVEQIQQEKQEKKERKLMMTDKELEEFQKNNNLN